MTKKYNKFKKFKKNDIKITFGTKIDIQNKNSVKVPYHLDDKGRRVFDLNKIKQEKEEKEEKRIENNKKLKINATLVCKSCGMAFTDNMAYQEHMNSKQHNKIVGNNMNIKEVTVSTIKEKMLKIKKERELIKEKERLERVEKNIKESNFVV